MGFDIIDLEGEVAQVEEVEALSEYLMEALVGHGLSVVYIIRKTGEVYVPQKYSVRVEATLEKMEQ